MNDTEKETLTLRIWRLCEVTAHTRAEIEAQLDITRSMYTIEYMRVRGYLVSVRAGVYLSTKTRPMPTIGVGLRVSSRRLRIWEYMDRPRTLREINNLIGMDCRDTLRDMRVSKQLLSAGRGVYRRGPVMPHATLGNTSGPRQPAPVVQRPEPIIMNYTHLNRGARVMRDALGADIGNPAPVTIADPRPAWEIQVETHIKGGIKHTIAKTPTDRFAVEARGVIQRGHWPAETHA